MSFEKHNGVPIRRPPSGFGIQSPKTSRRGGRLSNASCSSEINDFKFGGEKVQYEGVGAKEDSKETVATPVKTLLCSNITPRSNSRKSRAETASPSWIGTPNGATNSRPAPVYNEDIKTGDIQATSGLGLRISPSGRPSRRNSINSDGFGSSISSRTDPVKRNGPESAPKFFHADDIRQAVPSRPPSEQSLPQDGLPEYIEPDKGSFPNGRISSPSANATSNEQRAKLFYASDPNEFRNLPSKAVNGSSSNRPQLQTIYSSNLASSPPRPSSPLKEEIKRKSSISQPSPRRHTRLTSSGGSDIRSPEAVSVGKADLSRRSSLNSPRNFRNSSRTRPSSVSIDRTDLSQGSSPIPSNDGPMNRLRSPSVTEQYDTFSPRDNPRNASREIPERQLSSQTPSPPKNTASGHSKIDQINDLAANARRERKVLDLEISNSSLLAINRTLEREMGKQSAELRKFRRLSRSGRIPIAPSSRSTSRKMLALSEADTTIDSDDLVSSSDDENPLHSFPSDNSSTSSGSLAASPTLRAARARFQDLERPGLDLAAHRTLLSDSRKLNVSIRRCLAQSELLLSSGRRALECNKRPPEEENLGARVLTPDEIDGSLFGQGQALLSPSLDTVGHNPWERSLRNTGINEDDHETPDHSKWMLPTEVPTPSPEIEESPRFTKDIEEQSRTTSLTSENRSNQSREAFSNNDDRRASEVASIDGVDEESSLESETNPEDESHKRMVNDKISWSTSAMVNPISRAASPERGKTTNPQPDQPGYRGSMQGLSHYLQAFSIFGASQQA